MHRPGYSSAKLGLQGMSPRVSSHGHGLGHVVVSAEQGLQKEGARHGVNPSAVMTHSPAEGRAGIND